MALALSSSPSLADRLSEFDNHDFGDEMYIITNPTRRDMVQLGDLAPEDPEYTSLPDPVRVQVCYAQSLKYGTTSVRLVPSEANDKHLAQYYKYANKALGGSSLDGGYQYSRSISGELLQRSSPLAWSISGTVEMQNCSDGLLGGKVSSAPGPNLGGSVGTERDLLLLLPQRGLAFEDYDVQAGLVYASGSGWRAIQNFTASNGKALDEEVLTSLNRLGESWRKGESTRNHMFHGTQAQQLTQLRNKLHYLSKEMVLSMRDERERTSSTDLGVELSTGEADEGSDTDGKGDGDWGMVESPWRTGM